MRQNPTTVANLGALPATLPVWSDEGPSAASVLGIGRSLAWDMCRRGDLPTIRLGRRVVCPVPALLRMLGVEEQS